MFPLPLDPLCLGFKHPRDVRPPPDVDFHQPSLAFFHNVRDILKWSGSGCQGLISQLRTKNQQDPNNIIPLSLRRDYSSCGRGLRAPICQCRGTRRRQTVRTNKHISDAITATDQKQPLSPLILIFFTDTPCPLRRIICFRLFSPVCGQKSLKLFIFTFAANSLFFLLSLVVSTQQELTAA